jgi:heme oxygenase (biliverdin-producing, ferredoxin)
MSSEPDLPSQSAGLSQALRERTAALHRQAQRTGIMRDILRWQAAPATYALLLRNLWPVYAELERALERVPPARGAGRFARPVLYRAAAIARDLAALHGPGWAAELPLLAPGEHYAACVAEAAAGDGERLIAHAYTRYLGDLSGGQLIGAILSKRFGLEPDQNAFFLFEGGVPVETLRTEFRRDLDLAGAEISSIPAVVAEAARAFQCNIALFRAVQCACGKAAA